MKIDHNFSEKLKMSFFWSYYNDNHNSGQDGFTAPITATRFIPIRSSTIRLSADYTISPTLLLTPQRLASFGLNVNSTTDQALLSKTFTSGLPQARGFQIPDPEFPMGQTLEQALSPFLQFSSSLTPT